MFEVKIITDSINRFNNRLTTLQLIYPRFIHSEFMTHRVFSRNAMSSRAIPVTKLIKQVLDNPAMPIHWGQNKPGMQADTEVSKVDAERLWIKAANAAAVIAEQMAELGLHKQVANRILEPFQWMHTIVSATEWENFYELRAHPDAQPEFQKLAIMMYEAQKASTPRFLQDTEWHLPYILEPENQNIPLHHLLKISAARCARVSYLTHDGKQPSWQDDMTLFSKLAGGVPFHASPLEHQATPSNEFNTNFKGWTQHRALFEIDQYNDIFL